MKRLTKDSYIIARLYVPIIMIILLSAMIFFHRHHALRYLYIVNIICYLAAIITYFIVMNRPVGEEPRLWMNVVPFTWIIFIWIIGIFVGSFLSAISIAAFVIEHAQRHIWAKVMLGIAGVVLVVLCVLGIIYLILGILSMKSG